MVTLYQPLTHLLQVVPRQTCRLFTRNYLFEDFVGPKQETGGVPIRGREGLRSVAEGGEVFNTLLYNPVRTHSWIVSGMLIHHCSV